jgi:ribonuclease Z
MEPIFRYRLINDLFGDPALFIRILREKRALQFDLGDISGLAPSEIYKITDVFVTHTHIDHFIGFDSLLRAVLRRKTPLHIYGPQNITQCVAGKLRGYTWNLIRDYPLQIHVFAYEGKSLAHSVFKAHNRFKREDVAVSGSDGTVLEDPMFRVKTARLSHGTPCLAYSIEEESHINIDKDRVMRKGLEVGPWLSVFKKALRRNAPADSTVEISGKRYRMDRLSDIAKITEGQKITFATDVATTGKNIACLVELARDSDVFYCEAYFLEKDRARAKERSHLTAKTCGIIAKKAGVKKLFVSHISPRYIDCPDLVIKEAMEAFRS